jgi:predicted nucleic acid-binding Zn ribbon protein
MKRPLESLSYRKLVNPPGSNPTQAGPEPLANLVGRFLQSRSADLKKAAGVVDAWDNIIPEELRRCCRLGSVQNGVLSIEVPAGPYLYRMKTLSAELLDRFQRACPSARIQKIRFLPSTLPAEETATL